MIMERQNRTLRLSALAPLVLFAVFACCVVIVLLFGADIYQGLAQRDRESYQRRTAVQYLTTRIRQCDSVDMVFVGDFHEAIPAADGDVIFICETIGERTFYTRIYCYDGYLCELFGETDSGLEPADGERILEAEQMNVTNDNGTFWFQVVFSDEDAARFCVTHRAGKDAL